MRQRADRVESGLLDLPLNAFDLTRATLDQLLGLLEGQAGDRQRTDARHQHRAITLDRQVQCLVDPPPKKYRQRISRTQQVVTAVRRVTCRREGRYRFREDRISELFNLRGRWTSLMFQRIR